MSTLSVIQVSEEYFMFGRHRCVDHRILRGFLLTACLVFSRGLSETSLAQSATFSQAVVAADHPAASEAGAAMLRQGGNAVDAAVATSFALSVVRPASCGIGGGGFMVIWDADQRKAVALDYRERAPAEATADRFANTASDSADEPFSVRGGLAVGIPGTVRGLCYAAEEYGTLPLSTLLQPAIELCRKGVETDAHDMDVQSSTLAKFRQHDDYITRFASLHTQYLNAGQPWEKGVRFYSPQLKTLEAISQHGASGFYEGPVATAIASAVSASGGVLSPEDLKSYRLSVREVLTSSFHGKTILTMPPPSSGGVALLQTLQSLEAWEQGSHSTLKSLGHNSADYIHVTTEALKHAFADRAEFLGDTDYVKVPITQMLDPKYARQTADQIDLTKTLAPEKYGRFFAANDAGTSHFSVMDAAGNAVSCTETINLTFGSFVVVPEFGILLNNEMDDFTASPGKPNAFGLIQSAANAIQPGKRPLSSMTPTIVIENGRAIYACGASGGPRIITATLQNLLNHLVFDMTPQQAVSAPRFHHQWAPDELLLEPSLEKARRTELEQRGHVVKRSASLAASQAAAATAGQVSGGSDPRKHGQPSGL